MQNLITVLYPKNCLFVLEGTVEMCYGESSMEGIFIVFNLKIGCTLQPHYRAGSLSQGGQVMINLSDSSGIVD